MASEALLQSFIQRIHDTNIVACNVPQVLDSLDITVSSVPSINLYQFELIQNALDARADSIEIQLDAFSSEELGGIDDQILQAQKLVFLHNGPGGLGKDDDRHVRGMSNVFQSTKSVGSVGFMGFGFKTLYKRFSKVSVSDSEGWKFYFAVPEQVVSLHDSTVINLESGAAAASDIILKSRLWIGAVCPIWDDSIPRPDEKAFTTRFEMSSLVSTTTNITLYEDVYDALLSGEYTSLAVLGTQGLRRLAIKDLRNPTRSRLFELSYAQNVVSVSQLSPEPFSLHWKCFTASFKPGREATQALAQARLKNILQHHTQLERVLKDIQRPYKIVGLIPLAEDGMEMATRGQLFATLPVRSFVPFGISIQADWLLDLSRKGLRDIETNAWQQTIIHQIARMTACFLKSIRAAQSAQQIIRSFAIFGCGMDDVGSKLDSFAFSFEKFAQWLRKELEGIPIFPVSHSSEGSSDGGAGPSQSIQSIEWRHIDEVIRLPNTHYKPKRISSLIGLYAIDETLVSPSACLFFVKIGLIKTLQIEDALSRFILEGGIWTWYNGLDKSEMARREALIELWAFLAEFAPESAIPELKCIPVVTVDKFVQSKSNPTLNPQSVWHWISPASLSVLHHKGQFLELPEDPLATYFLETRDWNGPGRVAFEFVSRHWNKKELKNIARRAFLSCYITQDELGLGTSLLDRFDTTSKRTSPLGGLLGFSRWAASNDMSDLITHVLPDTSALPSSESIKPIDVALSVIGAPYVEAELDLVHSKFFSKWCKIHPIYNSISLSGSTTVKRWGNTFQLLGAKGPVVLEEFISKELDVYPSYSESRKKVADLLEISHDSVLDFQTTSRKGWKVIDTRFKDADLEERPEIWPYLAQWLEANIEALSRGDAMLVGQGEVWRVYLAYGKIGTAQWTRQLNQMAWVPIHGSCELVCPFEAKKEHVALTPSLILILEKKGVFFGRTSAQKHILDEIASFDASSRVASGGMQEDEIEHFASILKSASRVEQSQHVLVANAVNASILPVASKKRSTPFGGTYQSNQLPSGDEKHSSGGTDEGRIQQRSTIAFHDLIRIASDESSAESLRLSLNQFLVQLDDIPACIANAIEALESAGIITIPNWPTPDQARRYFKCLSEEANSQYRSHDIFPFILEYLAADQKGLRAFLAKECEHLIWPSDIVSHDGLAPKWLSLRDILASHQPLPPKQMLGVSGRVQKMVQRELERLQYRMQ